ncbi:MAG TPA: hypothetical protein VMT04_01840 [Terriglobales bacterium]|nr:hypothetical protein [Terriglobales bacterium]
MSYKRFKIVGLMLMVMVLAFSWTKAETLVTREETASPSINDYFTLMNYQSSQELYSLAQTDSSGIQKLNNMDVYRFNSKSSKKGFLYSLVVPGAGEYYAGSKIKAVLFFGLEAGFWTGYFSYHKKGKDKEKEYLNFANANWDIKAYSDSLVARYPDLKEDGLEIVVDTPGVYYGAGTDSIVLSHSLHPVPNQPINKNQQYYEEIGKYDQFRFGWKDYPDYYATSLMTALRNDYLNMRHDSNSLLDKANRFVMFSIANHLLSAFDAALAVRHYNRKGDKFSQVDLKIRLEEYSNKYNDNEIIPKFTVSTSF